MKTQKQIEEAAVAKFANELIDHLLVLNDDAITNSRKSNDRAVVARFSGEATAYKKIRDHVNKLAKLDKYNSTHSPFTTKRWEKALNHAKNALEIYRTIPTGTFAALNINALIMRYENGERTERLLESMEGVQL